MNREAILRLFHGASQRLPVGQDRAYGRADTGMSPADQPVACSRRQFQLECRPGGVRVTSLSAVNPTKVVLASGGCALLSARESRALEPGDRVLLLACDPSMFVRLVSSPVGGPPAPHGQPGSPSAAPSQAERQEQRAADGTPTKRARSEAGAAAAGAPAQQQQQHQEPAAPTQQQQPAASTQQQQQQPGAAGEPAAPVVVVMVGLQGSGKSTFCCGLVERAAAQRQRRRWTRVNQDSIGGGARGTREMCLAAAADALAAGASVLVDRTGLEAGQRRPFVEAAHAHGAQAHCVFLKLPLKVCQSRAAGRTDHEGGLQGRGAYPAVAAASRRLQDAGDPQLSEGFRSVLVCESDADAAAALEAWARYGPACPDPAAEYARLRPAKPKPLTIDRFFRKAQQGGSTGGGGKASGGGGGGGGAESASGPGTTQQQAGQEQAPRLQGQQEGQQRGRAQPPGAQPQENALAAMMAAARRPRPPPAAAAAASAAPATLGGRSRHNFAAAGAWANSLVRIAADPESCRAGQPLLEYDERCVWVADKYPKARQHWLVVARERRLGGPLDLAATDVPLLEHMVAVAARHVGAMQAASPGLRFRMGFHATPSLRQLHMHVISQDFDAPGLKHKKHWLSFTSGFFLDAAAVLEQLRAGCPLAYSPAEREALLRGELRCHRCGAPAPGMPALKAHVGSCAAPLRGPHLC